MRSVITDIICVTLLRKEVGVRSNASDLAEDVVDTSFEIFVIPSRVERSRGHGGGGGRRGHGCYCW